MFCLCQIGFLRYVELCFSLKLSSTAWIYTKKENPVSKVFSMYNVLDVCRYIINYSNEKEYGISNLKLQKILYFVQAYYLCFSHSKGRCFREDIVAWEIGSVVPKAYCEYSGYGCGNIPEIHSYFVYGTSLWNTVRVPYSSEMIHKGDKAAIRSVIDKFADYSSVDLMQLTQDQSPWMVAYQQGIGTVILDRCIREYFAQK